jgi:hypothetical protein
MKRRRSQLRFWGTLGPILAVLAFGWVAGAQAQVAIKIPLVGEIQQLTVNANDPAGIYAGGVIVVNGQNVILPRNLLIDLPANRLTLQQIFDQAPEACVALGQSGLAKGDSCNTSGMGGIATISANRTSSGNVIAGDVLIDKGLEAASGIVTFINHTDGYFRLNGNPGDDTTGVMVRLNDPGARHTIQQGAGCLPGAPNCSADPRFTLDGDNYTNRFTTGYPLCIASTVTGIGARNVGSDPTGVGDPFCPVTNRTVNNGSPVDDSRLFAPILLNDHVIAEGNFETVNGVRFLSSHSTRVSVALSTKPDLNQPDYLFMEEVFVDSMGFNNLRARTLFIGFATLNTDMRIWSRHWDPVTNDVHHFPLASVRGCDGAAGTAGTCGGVGLVPGGGGNIFKIRYDVDFDPTIITKKPELYPCANLRNDPEWAADNICPDGGLTVAENFAILSPTPHEIMVRSRKKTDSEKQGGTALITSDIQGRTDAKNGEYIFPMGINLGGIETPEFVEIDLAGTGTPWLFSGVPWNLDRRLGPSGCLNAGVCEGSPQPLDPFPFEILDPRSQATNLPVGPYSDPNFINGTLPNVRDRIFSFVNGAGDFTSTVLAWPPANPPATPISATPAIVSCATAGGGGGVNLPVTAVNDTVSTPENVAVTFNPLVNDAGLFNPATLATSATVPALSGIPVPNANGSITFTPSLAFFGASTFTYTVQDQLGGVSNAATVTVNVVQTGPGGNTAPVAFSDSTTTLDTTPVTINVLANDTDNGTAVVPANVTMQLLSQPTNGIAAVNADNTVTYTPVAPFGGTVSFSYKINDGLVDSNVAGVSVVVTQVNTPPGVPDIVAISNQTAEVGKQFVKLIAAVDTPDDRLTYALVTAPAGMTIGAKTGLINWTPTTAQVGPQGVTVQVTDKGGLSATSSFSVLVDQDTVKVNLAQFSVKNGKLRVNGLSTAPGATITVYNSPDFTGKPLGKANVGPLGLWNFKKSMKNAPNENLSVRSNGGGSLGNIHVRNLP